jgi:DNA-binding PadR family transcriptional regulator
MVAVVRALLDHPRGSVYTYELSKTTGLGTGTITPLLHELAEKGLVESRLSRLEPVGPPRRLFWLNPDIDRERFEYWIRVGGDLVYIPAQEPPS